MLGIIADDFTGATDVAGYLVREGTPTVQFFGLPGEGAPVPEGVGAVVVALKTRAIEPEAAVEQSVAALEWLRSRAGADHIYFKYCSTFDSTDRGNIGPVALALAGRLGEERVLVAPSAPENGRTVYQGKLFVFHELLSESPMRHHPVNPMHDSDLGRLLMAQGAPAVALIDRATVAEGEGAVAARLREAEPAPVLVVADALDNADLDILAGGAAASGRRLTSGSAGLGAALARRLRDSAVEPVWPHFPAGGRFVLSGSCSEATLRQVNDYRTDHPAYKIDGFTDWDATVAEATEFLARHATQEPLIYSTADAEEVRRVQQRWGTQEAAKCLEAVLAEVARAGVALGLRTIVVAGGETSGAVVQALDIRSIIIGREIAVGVPWCLSGGARPVALALKSGNFGGPQFFREALTIARAHSGVGEQ